jgi:hypothetical protein
MKKTFASAILIAALISMAPAAFAGEKKEKKKTEATNPVNGNISVRYMGEDNEFVVLQVILTKGSKSDAFLRINDGYGNELYNERFSSAEHVRYIKVSPDELKSIEVALRTMEGDLKKIYNLNMSKVSTFKIEEVAIK